MSLSFGMIFSIILIIFFVSFAFFAIKKFIEIGNTAKITKFVNDFQEDIDKIWKSSQGSQEQEYFIPFKIKHVCFADYSNSGRGAKSQFLEELRSEFFESENIFFYPPGSSYGMESKEMKHMDIGNMTLTENPSCIDNLNGKIKLTIEKNFGEALVRVSK